MYIVTDDLEIINFNQYKNLSVEGEDPGKSQLVLIAQDDSKRVIADTNCQSDSRWLTAESQ